MLPLVTLPTSSLREPSKKVRREELMAAELQKFCRGLVPAMYHYQGIGLAAPQVGRNLCICVIGKAADKSLAEDLILVNPELEILSRKKKMDSEGCLSVPNTFGQVSRYNRVQVRGWDVHGQPLEFEAKNFFARVIQHELDHLKGKLFVDRTTNTWQVTPESKGRYLSRRINTVS